MSIFVRNQDVDDWLKVTKVEYPTHVPWPPETTYDIRPTGKVDFFIGKRYMKSVSLRVIRNKIYGRPKKDEIRGISPPPEQEYF